MKKVFIKITEIDDVNKFVQYAKNVRGDVLVSRGQFCIDGKSILGIYSLDISQGCTVQYPENEKEFDNFIQQFMGE